MVLKKYRTGAYSLSMMQRRLRILLACSPTRALYVVSECTEIRVPQSRIMSSIMNASFLQSTTADTQVILVANINIAKPFL